MQNKIENKAPFHTFCFRLTQPLVCTCILYVKKLFLILSAKSHRGEHLINLIKQNRVYGADIPTAVTWALRLPGTAAEGK